MKHAIIIIVTLLSVCCGYCATIDVTSNSMVLSTNSASTNSTNLGTLITNATAGDVLYFPAGNYPFGNTVNDNKGVYFCGESKDSVTLAKDSSSSGAVIAVAPTTATSMGGIKNITFSYSGTANSCSGITFGAASITASNFAVENCDFKNFTLYGLEVVNGATFFIKNIRVLNHGSTTNRNAIGFYVCGSQANGVISNVYSEIGSSSTDTGSIAIKLQSMSKLVAENIYGKGGKAACVSVESLLGGSKITNLVFEAVTSSPGLLIKALSGSSYVLNGVRSIGSFSKSVDIAGAASASAPASCVGVTLMNVNTNSVLAENYAVVQNCKFINIACTQFQLDTGSLNTLYVTSGNQFVNISTAMTYPFSFNGDSNLVENIRAINAGSIRITGDANTINNCYSENCNAEGVKITGDNNVISNCHVKYTTATNQAPVWIAGGNANVLRSLLYKSTVGIDDDGTSTVTSNNYSY